MACPDGDYYHAGSNIGIIEDPFGTNPRLVAATRPLPNGFPWDLSLSSDGSLLYATYGLRVTDAGPGALFAYNVVEIVNEIQRSRNNLDKTAINDRVTVDSNPIRTPNPLIEDLVPRSA